MIILKITNCDGTKKDFSDYQIVPRCATNHGHFMSSVRMPGVANSDKCDAHPFL